MSGRGQSPRRVDPRYIDLKCFAPGRCLIGGIPAPAHGLLLRRPTRDLNRRVGCPADGPLAGIFFSKQSGQSEVTRLFRLGILAAPQARYACRAIHACRLPEIDPMHARAFRYAFEIVATSPFEDDETLGLGTLVSTPSGLIPFDIAVIRAAGATSSA